MLLAPPRVFLLLSLALLLRAQAPERDAFTRQYCLACHAEAVKAGGFALGNAAPGTRPDIWEKAAKRVRAKEMPPPGAPRPEETRRNAFLAGLIADLDAQPPYAGRPAPRRLNRAEYANAIRDLLDIELPLAAELPQDQPAAGFDNIADALTMSPLLLESYLRVARRVAALATGTGDDSPVVEIFPATGTQAVWQGEGMPFGTRGGIRVRHYFPRDGDYELRAFLAKESLTPLEGVRFFRARLALKAGSHEVVAAFPDECAEREGPVLNVGGPGGRALGGPLDVIGAAIRPSLEFRADGRRVKRFEIGGMTAGEAAFDGQPGPPTLGRIEIAGPYNAAGPGDTPSRRRIFVCRPADAAGEEACASRILSAIARRAFRRDVTARDVSPLLKTFSAARSKAGFDGAIAAALRDVLLSPDFLFRLEFDREDGQPGSAHPLSDFELASRLSFFLWSSIPDDGLLDAAAAGKLRGAVLAAEVRRMLADPRSGALLDHFVPQWLGLRAANVEPDGQLFPHFDRALAAAFRTETRMFVGSLIRGNRSVLDLLRADYSYLDERLAKHYGIEGVTGPGFRRVPLAVGGGRGGLLTQGGILLLTSHPTRTSPVLRGKWILENLLNSPPPPPPGNVQKLDESPAGGRKLTAREQVERHRANPACAGCHDRIDPLGFALENFDVDGSWRDKDEGGPIDPSAKLAGGVEFRGPRGLRSMLLGRSEEFAQAVTERLMTYALGRELDARDQPAVRGVLRRTEAGEYRFQDLIAAVADSVPFKMRQKQER
jgi:hypothetical protein